MNKEELAKLVPEDEIYNALLITLQSECLAMAKFILSNGLIMPLDTIRHLYTTNTDKDITSSLTTAHQQLAEAVYPALPKTIELLEREKNARPFLYFLGPVPLSRRLAVTAFTFLFMLLGVSLNANVNAVNVQLGLLHSENDILFVNQFFIFCCSGLGASFSSLFLANSYVCKLTYDSYYDSTYWSRIILGIIAGMIIVELLPLSLFEGATMNRFGKPSLAMLGGFSAGVVYRAVERITETMDVLINGVEYIDRPTPRAMGNNERR